jgi:NAD(P)-dependent dehydrogenase (short-subunit alcohol dehydrogenase family)
VITAAGCGMGAGAAKALAADGFHVVILSSSGKGEALAKELTVSASRDRTSPMTI